MERIPLFKVFVVEDAALRVEATLDSGYTGQGPRTQEFEKALRDFEALKSTPLATMTGTHALDLAYHLVGIKAGSKVISTPMTCTATNVPLIQRGAEILWADVDPKTGLIDPVSVSELVKENDVVAIVTVDWAGRPCNYKFLRLFGVPVIQDGAHSFGSHLEVSGDYRMWSFGAIKHLNCGGDGGALDVPEKEYERAKLLRWYGLDRSESASFRCAQDIVEAGYKYGMNDVAASIGLANIARSNWLLAKHRWNARRFSESFQTTPDVECLAYDEDCSYWFLPLLVDDRESFIAHMDQHGIDASEVHSRNDLKTVFPEARECPGLGLFSERQVNIPCGWWLNEADRHRIVDAVGAWKCPQPSSP